MSIKAVTSMPRSPEELGQLKDDIHKSLKEIDEALAWDEYMDAGDRAEIEILQAKLQSALTLLDNDFEGLEGLAGTAGTAATDLYNPLQDENVIRDVRPGWNGAITLEAASATGDPAIDGIVPGADFQGFVHVNDDGTTPNGVEIAFQLSETATNFEAFNRDKDIVYVETYKDEAGVTQRRFWVGVKHATNLRANILIDAHHLDHGVNIDLKQVLRISDGSNRQAGETGGFIVIGSDYDDTISGSQGNDIISGLKGVDHIYGEAGTDTLHGDDGYWNYVDPDTHAPVTPEMMRQRLGMRTDIPDGNDIIDGGVDGANGADIIDGDGGINYGFSTDANNSANINRNLHHTVEASPVAVNSADLILESDGWDIRPTGTGVFEVSENSDAVGHNSNLVLNMPPDFDMAFAEPVYADGSIRVNFVKHTTGGAPQTFSVIIRDGLRVRSGALSESFSLTINGNGNANIIDFHAVDLQTNNFTANGLGANDMILAPVTTLARDGLTLDDLTGSYNRMLEPELENIWDSIIPNHDEPDGSNAGVHAVRDGQEIIVSRGTLEGEVPGDQRIVKINANEFDKAYVVVAPDDDDDDEADLLVVLVRENRAGGSPTTVVVRIEDYARFQRTRLLEGETTAPSPMNLDWLVIQRDASSAILGGDGSIVEEARLVSTILPIILHPDFNGTGSGVTIDGGADRDFAFRYTQDEENAVESRIEASFMPEAGAPYDPLAGTSTGSTGSTTGSTGAGGETDETGEGDDAGEDDPADGSSGPTGG